MGLAWKSGVAAEVLCQPKLAIGSELYYSKIYLETPELFAWTALVIILSFILEKLFKLLLSGRWHRDSY
jgi:NitT/TauT family transport system permease protein